MNVKHLVHLLNLTDHLSVRGICMQLRCEREHVKVPGNAMRKLRQVRTAIVINYARTCRTSSFMHSKMEFKLIDVVVFSTALTLPYICNPDSNVAVMPHCNVSAIVSVDHAYDQMKA